MKRNILIFLLTAAALLTGCSSNSTDPAPAFQDVRGVIKQRTTYDVSWDTVNPAGQKIQQQIDTMLDHELISAHAVQIALLNNPRIQAVYEELGIAQAELVQAGLFKNPVFDFSIRFFEGSNDDDIVEMSLVQNFMDILLTPLRVDMEQAQLQITKAHVTLKVFELVAQTHKAFYSYQSAAQINAMYEDILFSTEAAYEAAQRLHDAGNITDLELARHRQLYEQTKLNVADSQNALLQARETLNAKMGLWGERAAKWTARPKLPGIPENDLPTDNIESLAINNSLNLGVIQKQIEAVAARMDIEVTEKMFAEFRTGISSERESDGTWTTGPAFATGIPIFDLGQAAEARGAAKIRQLLDNYTAAAIDLRAAGRSAVYRLKNAKRQASYYKKILVPLSEQITLETHLQYNAMQVGLFHLLDAKRDEIQTQLRYTTSLRNYWIARTQVELLLNGYMTEPAAQTMTPDPAQAMGGH
ncbi:Outer membrane efflux protein [Anaerohalosphaera lusitana]|uniref:Outer membrane efflux protein n=1 Tax=Anaerohalosphaera lusitana TaxID=1936003 RepID=A0A1U9NJN0_9BACT|nr:TolC family protein [Anaerohalosphaera lusitana]AQT68132.1 Outer membrane efflux protein [Anaerohalosphaera lusitana]